MPAITEHLLSQANALSAGIRPGRTGDPTIQSENTQRASQLAARGVSLWFPAGEYEFNGPINYTSQKNVKVWGDNAQIFQTSSTPQRTFEFSLCDTIEACGLHLHGEYFDSQTARSDSDLESLIWADRCKNVKIHNNICEGFNCWAVACIGGYNLTIRDNHFKDGHFSVSPGPNFPNTGDIRIQIVSGQPQWMGREIIIQGNQCNTESLVGIFSQYPTRKISCLGNMVITKDKDDNELTTYGLLMPKAGIELQYYTDLTQGNDDADSSQYEMNIDCNVISGVRFGGISFQSSTFANDNPGGVRGSISNNNIRYCGLEQAAATDRLQGGITVNQYRDITVANNVIKSIPNDVQNTEGTMGILIQNTNQRSQNTGGVLSSATVTGNIITDCQGRGIKLHECGDATVTGNICRDVAGQNFRVFDPGTERGGKVTVTGNRFVSELAVSDDIFRIEGGNSDYVINGNVFDFSGAFSGGAACMELYNTTMSVVGNRLKGPGGASAVGMKLMSTQNVRFASSVLANNHFEGFGDAIQGQSAAARGPWVLSNTAFENNVANIRTADTSQIWLGEWHNGKAVLYGQGPPSQGNWIEGDIIWNDNIQSAADPIGWVCTASGAQGTWLVFSGKERAVGQLMDDGSNPTQIVSQTPAPWDAFASSEDLSTPNVTTNAAAATIQLPDVTDPNGDVYDYSFTGVITPGSPNTTYVIQATVDGLPSGSPLLVDGRQSGSSLSFSFVGKFVIATTLAPVIGLEISKIGGGDDTITWNGAIFSLDRDTDF